MCSKTEKGGCQVWKCPWVSELNQRSSGCKQQQQQRYIRQTLLSMSSPGHSMSIKFTDTIQDVLEIYVTSTPIMYKNGAHVHERFKCKFTK